MVFTWEPVKKEEEEDEEVAEPGEDIGKKKCTWENRHAETKARIKRRHEDEEEADGGAKPISKPVRYSGRGRGRRSHYEAFECGGVQYELEDTVMLVPGTPAEKPYVAIIKWLYRAEDFEKEGCWSWQVGGGRDLFFSFLRDEVPAECVMHKCIVHFVSLHKQLPRRKDNPGFIVQKVYDLIEDKFWDLADDDFEDNIQHEIDILLQKTFERLGDLPDTDTEDAHADQEDQLKRKRNASPLDVSEDSTAKSDKHFKAETPGSSTSNASVYHAILVRFNGQTGESARDRWLERLLQTVQYVFTSEGSNDENGTKCPEEVNGSEEQKAKKGEHPLIWPDAAVSAVTALEKAAHQALPSDLQQYHQKLWQLFFNLKENAHLARSLLNGELEPSKILNMSPGEMKEFGQ